MNSFDEKLLHHPMKEEKPPEDFEDPDKKSSSHRFRERGSSRENLLRDGGPSDEEGPLTNRRAPERNHTIISDAHNDFIEESSQEGTKES